MWAVDSDVPQFTLNITKMFPLNKSIIHTYMLFLLRMYTSALKSKGRDVHKEYQN